MPLCCCEICHRRWRVLPVEIAPFKHFTCEVIETCCTSYSDAQLPGITLRRTVDWLGPWHPHYSSLHGWIGGLGDAGERDVHTAGGHDGLTAKHQRHVCNGLYQSNCLTTYRVRLIWSG